MNRRGWLKTIGAAVVGCLVPFKLKQSNTYGYSRPFPRITPRVARIAGVAASWRRFDASVLRSAKRYINTNKMA